MTDPSAIPPEFSRPVAVAALGAKHRTHVIEANPAERAALARRFGILDIGRLRAELQLKAIAGTALVEVAGTFEADVTQACVVTADPVASHLSADLALTYGPDRPEEAKEVTIEFGDDDPPEPIVDGMIDLGEAVAQHLALALDPFPRKADAEFGGLADSDRQAGSSPFASLSEFRRKLEK